jgi:hypothetical protein
MPSVMVFVLAMVAGMIIEDQWARRVYSAVAVEDDALSPSTDG